MKNNITTQEVKGHDKVRSLTSTPLTLGAYYPREQTYNRNKLMYDFYF
jgi:hypothetical protein